MCLISKPFVSFVPYVIQHSTTDVSQIYFSNRREANDSYICLKRLFLIMNGLAQKIKVAHL